MTARTTTDSRTGEREYTRMVEQYKSTIYSVCYMFSKDHDEVSDLFQEILIKLWKGFDSFRGESSARTWIYRIALNVCLDADRKKKRAWERVPLTVDINPFEDTDDDALQIRQLYQRIGKLGLIDRSIILMWLESLSYDEIGAIVGMTPNNVSVRLVRIKEKLKNL